MLFYKSSAFDSFFSPFQQAIVAGAIDRCGIDCSVHLTVGGCVDVDEDLSVWYRPPGVEKRQAPRYLIGAKDPETSDFITAETLSADLDEIERVTLESLDDEDDEDEGESDPDDWQRPDDE